MTGRIDYRADVLPKLTVETVYRGIEWTSQRGRYWKAPCPLHDDRDRRSRRFSVDTQTLGYKCFSCQASGDALKWLAGGGEVTAETYREAGRLAGYMSFPHTARSKSIQRPKRKPHRRTDSKARTGKRMQIARQLAAAATPADGSPATAYLTVRLAWPVRTGWSLPPDVRWIAAADVRRVLRWPDQALPPDPWAGCMACLYRAPEADTARALKLEALTAEGSPCKPRWRRNIGELVGLRFAACNLPGGSLHLAEGEVTALALAVQCQALRRGAAVACGGTPGMTLQACSDPARRPVLIHCDRDHAGRLAAIRLARTLRAAGREVAHAGIEERETDGMDAADVLAGEVGERVAIREAEGAYEAEALAGAWSDVLEMLAEGRLRL